MKVEPGTVSAGVDEASTLKPPLEAVNKIVKVEPDVVDRKEKIDDQPTVGQQKGTEKRRRQRQRRKEGRDAVRAEATRDNAVVKVKQEGNTHPSAEAGVVGRHVIKSEAIKSGEFSSDSDVDDVEGEEFAVMMVTMAGIKLEDNEAVSFSSEKKNKLTFWQALCVQFGIARLPDTERLVVDADFHTPPKFTLFQRDDNLPIVPASLNKCKKLLKTHAHVNIVEYLDERSKRINEIKTAGGSMAGEMLLLRNNQGALAHLVHPSAGAMIRQARNTGRVARIGRVKKEWMHPLLRNVLRRPN